MTTTDTPVTGDTVRFIKNHQFRFGVVQEIRGKSKAVVLYDGNRRVLPISELTVWKPNAQARH